MVEAAAARLKKAGPKVALTGARVHTTFQGLDGAYQAPEAGDLFASTRPVKTTSAHVGSQIAQVGRILDAYAAEMRTVVNRLNGLKGQAQQFVNGINDDDKWREDQTKVDEHNQILSQVNAHVVARFAVERRHANAIHRLIGAPEWHAGTNPKDPYAYGPTSIPANAATPWGKAEQTQMPLWANILTFPVRMQYGFVVDGLGSLVKLAWTLTPYNAALGALGVPGMPSLAETAQAWKGLGLLAFGAANPVVNNAYRYAAKQGWVSDGAVPLVDGGNTALKNFGKGFIAWDLWGKDPARAIGAVGFNVATLGIPGPKGAGAIGKLGGTANDAGRAAGLADDTARAGNTVFHNSVPEGPVLPGRLISDIDGIRTFDAPSIPDAPTAGDFAGRIPDSPIATLPDEAGGAASTADNAAQAAGDTAKAGSPPRPADIASNVGADIPARAVEATRAAESANMPSFAGGGPRPTDVAGLSDRAANLGDDIGPLPREQPQHTNSGPHDIPPPRVNLDPVTNGPHNIPPPRVNIDDVAQAGRIGDDAAKGTSHHAPRFTVEALRRTGEIPDTAPVHTEVTHSRGADGTATRLVDDVDAARQPTINDIRDVVGLDRLDHPAADVTPDWNSVNNVREAVGADPVAPPARTAVDEPPLPTRSLQPGYAEWDAGQGVRHFDAAELEKRRLFVHDGKLYDVNGQPFDTTHSASIWGGNQHAIYVMDRYGNLYVSTAHRRGYIHHSSFFRGHDVAGAGELEVKNGVVKHIDRESGHYRPDEYFLRQVKHTLREQGLDVRYIEHDENAF